MGKEDVAKLLVDIGNTNYHLLYIFHTGEYKHVVCNQQDLSSALSLLDGESEIYISSVNKDRLALFKDLLKERELNEPLLIDPTNYRERTRKIGIAISNIDYLGSDLFLDILGGEKSSLIADFGTASKFLFVDKHGVYQGGSLGLGLKATNAALAKSADLLEEYEVELPDEVVSLNTKDAINIDTVYGSANKLIALYRKIKKAYNEHELKLTITGTDGEIICSALKRLNFISFQYDKLHTFKGMIKVLDLKLGI